MAVFANLADKLQATFQKLTGKGRLSEADISEAMREIRLALLEADVSYKVVKEFVARIKEKALGSAVLESLSPGQQVISIVYEELTALMGPEQAKLAVSSSPPTVVMMVGLQGCGKTTSSAKIANLLKKQGRRPLLAAADIYRPAAIKQLQVLGESTGIPVFSLGEEDPVTIARGAVAHAKLHGNDYVLIDTAGRLQINEELMAELKKIKAAVNPTEILLVVDAMAGQDAVNVAEAFHADLGITGLVLTKLDGDTRGGAALSVKAVTGQPIKFVGQGEKIEAIEPFYPDRLASRILGMGDVLTLIEKAQSAVDEKKAREMQEKILKADFTFEDFLEQLGQMKKMGDMQEIISMLPGGMGKQLKDVQVDEKEFVRIEAIIQSMTKEERKRPEIINASRKKRIAKGSGTAVQDVNRLLKKFEQSKKMMKLFGNQAMLGGKKKGMFRLPF